MLSMQEPSSSRSLMEQQESTTIPPYSPIVFKPAVKMPYPFETEYSRDPERVREVFDDYVEKTKEMNEERPETYSGKRRALKLALKVDIGQAKGLHWRSIQARQPAILTTSPSSPPRTPRRPATEYPSAESLCLRNVADAQKKQNYIESCRWSVFAERERAIAKWEAEQLALYRANQAIAQRSPNRISLGSPSISSRRVSQSDRNEPFVTNPFRPRVEPMSPFTNSTNINRSANMPHSDPVVEMPYSIIDGSQTLHASPSQGNYMLAGPNQLQSFPQVDSDPFRSGSPRLSRSSSMQRHIPPTSLRMAPTPLRPRIDHHAVSYPAPQATRLSYIQPAESNYTNIGRSLTDAFPSTAEFSTGETLTSLPSSLAPVTPTSFDSNDQSLKKRRSDTEHAAMNKRKLWQ